MSSQRDPEDLLRKIDELWSDDKYHEALQLGHQFVDRFPKDPAGWHRLAILHVGIARLGPDGDHLGEALSCLRHSIELDPRLLEPRELRANLLMAMVHQPESPFTQAMGKDQVLEMTMAEFLLLERDFPDEEEGRLDQWRLESARAAFLLQRNRKLGTADFSDTIELYNRTNPEIYDAGDWFFRGLATLEATRPDEDPELLRTAAACFLRALEEESFLLEGRYFAADALLLLDEPTDEEFQHAALLIQELEKAPSRDFIIDVLKRRLELRAQLTDRSIPDFSDMVGDDPSEDT
ncbi:MAG: hypothetical protein JJU11_14515 [Candidatus Sumerlaeia bacterium]|nr:hypothetical protein [Candidatus Sumerlaeia bacterium]